MALRPFRPECRRFSEPRSPIDWKRVRGAVIAYAVIIGVLALTVVLLNSFVIKDAVIENQWMTGEDLTGVKAKRRLEQVCCVGEIISFEERRSYETSPNLKGIIGKTSLRIISPASEKGRIIAIMVRSDKNREAWTHVGSKVRITVSKAALTSGMPLYSVIPSPIPLENNPSKTTNSKSNRPTRGKDE